MSRTGRVAPKGHIFLSFLVALVLLHSASCSSKPGGPSPQPQTPAQTSNLPTGAQSANEPEDGQWLMPAKNYASTRFSGLDQINPDNVKNLKVAWTFSTGVDRGQEAAPLVVGSTMYVVTPYPNILYALDLKNDGALKWKYEPNPAAAAQGVACCDVVNRGAAYADGRIFYNTLDAHTVAVDAATGKLVWSTQVGDINKGESVTMAPLFVKGKVLVGNSGGEFGVRDICPPAPGAKDWEPSILERARRRIREQDRRTVGRRPARETRIHLVGAAPRLHTQHLEGGRVRRCRRRARELRAGGDDRALLSLVLRLRLSQR